MWARITHAPSSLERQRDIKRNKRLILGDEDSPSFERGFHATPFQANKLDLAIMKILPLDRKPDSASTYGQTDADTGMTKRQGEALSPLRKCRATSADLTGTVPMANRLPYDAILQVGVPP